MTRKPTRDATSSSAATAGSRISGGLPLAMTNSPETSFPACVSSPPSPIGSNQLSLDPKLASGDRGGLHYDALIRKSEIPTVLVAFCGTVATSWRDWFANFSWFTGLIPIENEYAVARQVLSRYEMR